MGYPANTPGGSDEGTGDGTRLLCPSQQGMSARPGLHGDVATPARPSRLGDSRSFPGGRHKAFPTIVKPFMRVTASLSFNWELLTKEQPPET